VSIEIGQVVVERRHGHAWCGLLLYALDGQERILPWSADMGSPRQLVLKLFPSPRDGHLEAVQIHYRELADAIVAQVQPPAP